MSRSRSRLATASVALTVLLLSACGSQLAPGDVVAAGGTTGTGGVVVGADGQPVAVGDDGTVTSGDTGSGTGPPPTPARAPTPAPAATPAPVRRATTPAVRRPAPRARR